MRKTELKNCPQLLLDADTENEDVDFDGFGILIWRGGNFLTSTAASFMHSWLSLEGGRCLLCWRLLFLVG